MKHARGPWKAVFPKGSNGYWDITNKDGDDVATCYGRPDAEGNARLIARAANAFFAASEARRRERKGAKA